MPIPCKRVADPADLQGGNASLAHSQDSLVRIYLSCSCLVVYDLLSNNSTTKEEVFTFLALPM